MLSFKRVILRSVSALCIMHLSLTSADVYFPHNIQYESDFVLSNRGCFTAQLGNDYITRIVGTMIEQYINRFNDETSFTVENVNKNGDTRIVSNYINTHHNGK